jgi:hypothetical protein
MTCESMESLSATSDTEWLVSDVRRGLTGAAYASVTVTVRVYDPTGATPLTAAITAAFDSGAGGYVAIIPPVSNVYALAIAIVRVTVVADGRTRVTDTDVTVQA